MNVLRASISLVLLAGLMTSGAHSVASDDLPTIENPRQPDPDLERFFGKTGLAVIQRASRVDAFRLDPAPPRLPKPAPPSAKEMLGLPVTATHLDLPADLVSRIKAVVLTPRIYSFAPGAGPLPPGVGVGKGCRFRPGVVFRFVAKGATPVDTYLCFSCNDLGLLRRQDVPTRDISAGRLDLLAAASEAFPDDSDLKGLYADTKMRWGNRLTGR